MTGKVKFRDDNADDDDDDDDIPGPPAPAIKSPPSHLPGTPVSKNNNIKSRPTVSDPCDERLYEVTPSTKFRVEELRGNLMRAHQNQDPLFYYEIVSVLGVGSMGSVAKVAKRASTVGGSARKAVQKHFKAQKRQEACFALPLVGGMFRICADAVNFGGGDKNALVEETNNSRHGSSAGSSSLIHGSNAVHMEDYNDGHGESFDKHLYAMKSIHLSRVTDPTFLQELRNEISILRTLDHYHIAKAMETFEYRNQIFVVMELLSGGDLYSRDPYSEEEAARITSCILSAIAYMHGKGISHRDLKYENILFVDNSPHAEIKLIDFGLSKKFGKEKDMTEGVGTIYSMSPEVLKGSYTSQADLWSVGVLTFMLLSSQMPFYGRKRRHIVEQIMGGQFEFKGRRWKKISEPARQFVADLLVVDPTERMGAEEAMSATWLNRRFSATMRNPYEEEMQRSRQALLRYAKYSRLKKLALMVVAHKSSSAEIGILRKIFQRHDTKKDGQLSFDEFKAAIHDDGFSERDYRQIFDSVDVDGTGVIRYTEFLAATIEAQGPISEERLAEAFDRIDSDDTGYITVEDLKDMLGSEFPVSEMQKIIKEADLTKDNRISYEEFLALWDDQDDSQPSLSELRNNITDSQRSYVSDLSTETPETAGCSTVEEARSLFVREKQRLSERRSVPQTIQAQKHVLFSNSVEHVPNRRGSLLHESDSDATTNNSSSRSGANNVSSVLEEDPKPSRPAYRQASV